MKIKNLMKSLSVSGMALLMLAPTVSANSTHHMKGMHHHARSVRMSRMPNRHGKYRMKMHHSKKSRHMKMGKKHMRKGHKKQMKMNKKHMHMSRKGHMKGMNMNNMMRIHGTKAPKGLKVVKHPRFRKGSHVIVKADHMPGMKDAHAKVVGAYKAKLYEVTYRSTMSHKLVHNHKWVIGREIKASRKGALHVGEHVTLKANHMKGMYNAKATIVGIHKGPAYMINYRPTNHHHMLVTNHKWIAQDELAK